ncbi:MAG: hypothetical protein A2147_01680 [Chloroflexi bacterium RBG_16_57_8]|nr:MAG: hypothetical protein A2147_01680 [Chloroflexi bacterium RBG_16_57_8]
MPPIALAILTAIENKEGIMDWGLIGERLLFVAAIVAFLLLFSIFRGRNPRKARAEMVRTLLSETRINLILVDTFHQQPKVRRFETTHWQLNKKKVDFLGKLMQEDLANAFGQAMDHNARLNAAKKSKSTEKVVPDLEGMKAPLVRIKRGLEDWLLANVGRIDESERPGMIDGLFGR